MKIFAKWIIVSLAFLVLPEVIPGIAVASFQTALIVALFWGLANLVIKPIILLVLLPITLITLGLFTFVVNALLLWGLGNLIQGFSVAGFVPAFLGALVLTGVSMVANFILKNDD